MNCRPFPLKYCYNLFFHFYPCLWHQLYRGIQCKALFLLQIKRVLLVLFFLKLLLSP
ncbi:hypothetical protein FLV31_17415 [Cellulophaga baltica]|nr:hypothetical protein [Cellulophaga baltica]